MKKYIKIPRKMAIFCPILVSLLVLVDFITKRIVMANMQLGDSIQVIKGVLHFTYIRNDGAAFGSMSNMRPLFMTLSVVMIVALTLFSVFIEQNGRLFYLSVSLVISGGIGNMIDRIFYKSVVDFVDFIALPNLWVWIFNVADSAVTVGVILLIFHLIKEEITHAGAVKMQKIEENCAENHQEKSED